MYSEHTITLKDGRKLGFAEYGYTKGKPLLFFHGWPSSRTHAAITEKAANKLKIRVIALDRPGFGLSDDKKDRTLLGYANDVQELADSLGLKSFAIIGISGGGPYAAACAYALPKRITKAGIVVGLAPTYIPGILEGISLPNRIGWANFGRLPFLADISSFLGWIEAHFSPKFLSVSLVAKTDKAMIDENFKKNFSKSRKEAFKQGFAPAAKDLKLYTTYWGFNQTELNSLEGVSPGME